MAPYSVLLIGLLLANVPFFSERVAGVLSLGARKGAWIRLAEWLVSFFVFMLLAVGIERRVQGTVHSQDWEFYIVLFFMFSVFAAPGFVWRYLWLQYRKV